MPAAVRREQPKKWFTGSSTSTFAAFPLMQLAFQVGDIKGLFTRDCRAPAHGATALELAT